MKFLKENYAEILAHLEHDEELTDGDLINRLRLINWQSVAELELILEVSQHMLNYSNKEVMQQ
jgi:hypothetical protein